jgi:hypothetical protein
MLSRETKNTFLDFPIRNQLTNNSINPSSAARNVLNIMTINVILIMADPGHQGSPKVCFVDSLSVMVSTFLDTWDMSFGHEPMILHHLGWNQIRPIL